MSLSPWQLAAVLVLQGLFAACATSVLVYRALGVAPEVIDFGWLSYRTFNIAGSILLVAYIAWGLLRDHRHIYTITAAFSLFHLIEGAVIGFWIKAVLHLLVLLVLAPAAYRRLGSAGGEGGGPDLRGPDRRPERRRPRQRTGDGPEPDPRRPTRPRRFRKQPGFHHLRRPALRPGGDRGGVIRRAGFEPQINASTATEADEAAR
jgi:hypothetical protein